MRGPNQAGKSYLKIQSSSCLAVENVDFLEKFTVFENTENVSFTSILFLTTIYVEIVVLQLAPLRSDKSRKVGQIAVSNISQL